jgi:hypothetical protein
MRDAAPGLLGLLLQGGILVLAAWTGRSRPSPAVDLARPCLRHGPLCRPLQCPRLAGAQPEVLTSGRWLSVFTLLVSMAGLVGAAWLAVNLLF